MSFIIKIELTETVFKVHQFYFFPKKQIDLRTTFVIKT